MDLEYEYTPREKRLLTIIGEAYLGLRTDDYSYYKSKLNQAINELEELQGKLAKNKEIIIYRAYKNPDSSNFKYEDFNTKSEALNFVKNNNWDVVTKFVYADEESYDNDTNRLEETDVYVSPAFNYKDSKFRDKDPRPISEIAKHVSVWIDAFLDNDDELSDEYRKPFRNIQKDSRLLNKVSKELKTQFDDLDLDLNNLEDAPDISRIIWKEMKKFARR